MSSESGDDVTKQGEEFWRPAWDAIVKFRSTNVAPVDTTGAATQFDPKCSEKDIRFQKLLGVVLSARVRDQVLGSVMKDLMTIPGGLNVDTIADASIETLQKYVRPLGFSEKRAHTIKQLSKLLISEHAGDVPKSVKELKELPGCGIKVSHLALQLCWGKSEGVSADTHVHRIANRLHWVETRTPEASSKALTALLPQEYWARANPLLVGFGQLMCKPQQPCCYKCPVHAINECPIGRELQGPADTSEE